MCRSHARIHRICYTPKANALFLERRDLPLPRAPTTDRNRLRMQLSHLSTFAFAPSPAYREIELGISLKSVRRLGFTLHPSSSLLHAPRVVGKRKSIDQPTRGLIPTTVQSTFATPTPIKPISRCSSGIHPSRSFCLPKVVGNGYRTEGMDTTRLFTVAEIDKTPDPWAYFRYPCYTLVKPTRGRREQKL